MAGKTGRVFTGLVEEVGRLLDFKRDSGGGGKLKVGASLVLEDVTMGASIAVNGTCLTVVQWSKEAGWVLFDAVQETLNLTTLSELKTGDPLNLERALAVGARVGGHYVTGHVDGPGTLRSIEKSGNGVIYKFAASTDLLALVAPKGSITVDGISLTVVDVGHQHFSVWIVPHTASATNLSSKKVGDTVNLETDILAKYVQKSLQSHSPVGSQSASTNRLQNLQKAGFLS